MSNDILGGRPSSAATDARLGDAMGADSETIGLDRFR
jgi:hypothetical protein